MTLAEWGWLYPEEVVEYRAYMKLRDELFRKRHFAAAAPALETGQLRLMEG